MFSRIAALRLPFELPFARVTGGRFFCHIEHLKRAGPRDALSLIFMMFTQQIWYTSVSIHIERYDQD